MKVHNGNFLVIIIELDLLLHNCYRNHPAKFEIKRKILDTFEEYGPSDHTLYFCQQVCG